MSSLLDHSSVLLYGREVKGVTLDASAGDGLGANGQLRSQLKAKDSKLATIYGFEFEGHYYDLPAPTILLVHGDSEHPGKSGSAVKPDPELADDVEVWCYDKADFSIRLDIDSGPLETILLEEALEESGMAAQTSAKRMSGKRVSGKRMSGD